MDDKNIIGKFLFLTKNLKETYEKEIELAAKKIGLTKPEADILLFLSNNKYNTACEIVAYRGFSKAYVSKAINLLNKKRYISIEKNDSDKRFQKITITPHADDILKELKKAQINHVNKLKTCLDDNDLIIFKNIINKMYDNLKREGRK